MQTTLDSLISLIPSAEGVLSAESVLATQLGLEYICVDEYHNCV